MPESRTEAVDIVMKRTDSLIPYAKNPRNNDNAVDAVAASISEFGFKVPIVLDRDGVVINGHTRLKAAQKLRIKEVPCIVADDLTPEQAKAFRLADNKVSELALWDFDKLQHELDSIDFDMTLFGFDELVESIETDLDVASQPVEDDARYYGDERDRTFNTYNLYDFVVERTEGPFEMPIIRAEQHVPESLVGFNYVLNTEDTSSGVHFYLDDYQFERIWADPHKYMERLKEFDCVLTPDFSLYIDMPMAMKIWNVYRSRLIGQIMQDYGIKVIPTLSWAEDVTFAFCFDGIEPGGTVSVSTIGVKKDSEARGIWEVGMKHALEHLEPRTVIVYGGDIGFDFKDTNVVYIDNEVVNRWKESSAL